MFIDGRGIPNGTILETDIAIIGAGAAGITIARELIGGAHRVALIESGGFDLDDATQALYEGESKGVDYPLDAARLRYFGGSTNHWGGWCRPLAPIDFEARPWLPHSGWPITRAILDPYYDRAQRICQLGSGAFDDAEAWRASTGWRPLDLPGDDFVTRFFLYSPPTRFGETYRSDIAGAGNITAYLNSNVTEIVPNEAATRVERLRVATLNSDGSDGRQFEIRPRLCILASGGIENARLLLLSDSVQKNGLGNGRDLVGRFFMEHVHVPGQVALIAVADPDIMPAYYNEPKPVGGASVRAILMPSDAYLRREQRLSVNIAVYPQRPAATGGDMGAGESETGDMAGALESGILQLLRPAQDAAKTAIRRPTIFGASCAAEPVPLPHNRITLSASRDALGQRRTILDWRPSPLEHRDLNRNMDAMARAFGAWGGGIVRVLFAERNDWVTEEIGWGNHHMGTTRMADDPGQGVVDANCRVHGLSNLYVAGSSVFPTGGPVNPTLTIVALGMRLADHIKSLKLAG